MNSGSVLAEQAIDEIHECDVALGGGVVIAGDITLAVADVDLVHVSLRALISSVEKARPQEPQEPREP